MGIMRWGLLLVGGVMFLPSPPDDGTSASDLGTGSYMAAAINTASDLGSFCARQPTVCDIAGFAANQMQRKIKYGVQLISHWADGEPVAGTVDPSLPPLGEEDADPIITGSTDQSQTADSQSTLEIEDLIPPWLGPKSAKG